MIGLRQGHANDAEALSFLILSSAPVLLPYLFNGQTQSLAYINKACQQLDGQYSANRHKVAVHGNNVVACMTLWDDQLLRSFHNATVKSLHEFLTTNQLTHLINSNESIAQVFLSPTSEQLCVGHLAVNPHHKGQGLGKKLIAYAIKEAKIRAKSQIVLDVDSLNDEALSFYYGLGFLSIKESYFAPTNQRFIRMQYSL